tara:strand:- start:60 stop:395 length:336 start_codon:yes stop_codon:yes gene_type:complete
MAETFNNAALSVTSSLQDLYQAPTSSGNKAIILSVLVANCHGSASDNVTLSITNSGNTEQSKIASTVAIPNDATLECIPNKVVLNAGEKLRIKGDQSSGYLKAFVSVLEIT